MASTRMFSDSQAAVEVVRRRATDGSQKEVLAAQKALNHQVWKERVKVEWCPGHAGVGGNEVADWAAGEAARAVPPAGTRYVPTVARVRTGAKEKRK